MGSLLKWIKFSHFWTGRKGLNINCIPIIWINQEAVIQRPLKNWAET